MTMFWCWLIEWLIGSYSNNPYESYGMLLHCFPGRLYLERAAELGETALRSRLLSCCFSFPLQFFTSSSPPLVLIDVELSILLPVSSCFTCATPRLSFILLPASTSRSLALNTLTADVRRFHHCCPLVRTYVFGIFYQKPMSYLARVSHALR